MKLMVAMFEVNDDADLSRLDIVFKDKNGTNPYAAIHRHVHAQPLEEFLIERTNDARRKEF